jgi:hypothetical protein
VNSVMCISKLRENLPYEESIAATGISRVWPNVASSTGTLFLKRGLLACLYACCRYDESNSETSHQSEVRQSNLCLSGAYVATSRCQRDAV